MLANLSFLRLKLQQIRFADADDQWSMINDDDDDENDNADNDCGGFNEDDKISSPSRM